MTDKDQVPDFGFPKTSEELAAFDEKHKDFKFMADPKKIDPEKILNDIKMEEQKAQARSLTTELNKSS